MWGGGGGINLVMSSPKKHLSFEDSSPRAPGLDVFLLRLSVKGKCAVLVFTLNLWRKLASAGDLSRARCGLLASPLRGEQSGSRAVAGATPPRAAVGPLEVLG